MSESKSQGKSQSRDVDRIVTVTVGEPPKPLNAPVTLVEYDSNWPTLFSQEAERIRNASGDLELVSLFHPMEQQRVRVIRALP